ncbi:MAG: 4-hydroxy-tetrahydrodipicolinate reductase, partial [Rhodococcus sp. (in: high G+C Gram-positive bacteria)]
MSAEVPVRVGVLGARGKVGQAICAAVEAAEDL